MRSFGYVMRLRDADYVGMRDLIAAPPRRVDPPLSIRAILCLRIAQSFLELHASGFCYQDINFGNIFFRPDSGDILICDNDNVDIDGAMGSVFGTRKFMAPEIVRDGVLPATNTDLFSMAVLFFYVLHAWHPLDGRAEAEVAVMDAAAELRLYGQSPVFLFDPEDTSNGPVAGMHEPILARWNALSPRIRGLFQRSFTIGLRTPAARVLEAEWCAAFSAMATAAFPCPRCGFEHVASPAPGGGIDGPRVCAACGAVLAVPPMLAIGRALVSLAPGRGVPAFLLQPDQPMDFATLGASVEAHPTNPGIFGLRNRTEENWRATLPDRSTIAVPPGRTMRLIHGATIAFGKAVGTCIVTPVDVPAPDAPVGAP